ALGLVAQDLTDRVRMGLMMYAETGTNGAYVRYGVRNMNLQNRNAFTQMVSNFVQNGNGTDSSGSNQPFGHSMLEAFKYFGGDTSTANENNDTAGSPQDATHFGPIAYAGGASNNAGTYRRDYPGNNPGSVNQAN